jgi:hypothetical protein
LAATTPSRPFVAGVVDIKTSKTLSIFAAAPVSQKA